SLTEGAAVVVQEIALCRGLYAAGDDWRAVQAGNIEHRPQQSLALGRSDPEGELAVDLDHIERKIASHGKQAGSSAKTVDRNAEPELPQLSEQHCISDRRSGGGLELQPLQRKP